MLCFVKLTAEHNNKSFKFLILEEYIFKRGKSNRSNIQTNLNCWTCNDGDTIKDNKGHFHF